ncbi:acyltransferase [Microbacterium sp. KSW-18]|uniref:Acyltransferase n=1 Tax=Microbacterium aquilitoris TaxID=3067307 RepID=A0ABU3GPL0_9MICO|nr:acyltransferase [Microbacterium sp. KSW-18]MDT3331801.1 acyltransferase [Microbacterium sp. KSW-18]
MKRLTSLDGLRGLAALIVLVHHIMLTFPLFAEPYLEGRAANGLPELLSYTPLHTLWDGQGAVVIFFVLSGVVLTLPVLKQGRDFSWVGYYPQRLLRLYLPVWGAIILYLGWVLIIPRTTAMESAWLGITDKAVSPEALWGDATLLFGTGDLVSPLWSLQWEIAFSFLLPVFVFLGVRFARYNWILAVAAVIGIAVSSSLGNRALVYLPMFLIGVVIATWLPTIRKWQPSRGTQALLLLSAPILLIFPWLIRPFEMLRPLVKPFDAVTTIGATIAVIAAIVVPIFRRFLESRAMQWFGLISFSLYLVHEPVVISMAHLFGDQNLRIAGLVSVVISIPLSWVFFKVVEIPSHKLSRRVGDFVRSRTKKRPQPHAPIAPDIQAHQA